MSEAVSPVATIVITNYNYEHFVTDAVKSAFGQTVACQVVVVDDGSTDGSQSVLATVVEQHPDLQVITTSNGGQAAAMNVGWAAATADVVLFLDGDDRLHPEAVEAVELVLLHEPTAVRCQFRLQWIDGDGVAIEGGFPEADRLLPSGDLQQCMTVNPDDLGWQPTSGNAFTAGVLKQIMPIPEAGYRISADHYLSNISPLYGPVLGIERNLGDYRVHGKNQDHRAEFDLGRIRSILARTDETRRHLIDHGQRLDLAAMPTSPDDFVSLTTAGMRLISFRLGEGSATPNGTDSTVVSHPFPADRRGDLVRVGLRAAMARRDFSPQRRAIAAAWICALAVAPRSTIPRIAEQALTR